MCQRVRSFSRFGTIDSVQHHSACTHIAVLKRPLSLKLKGHVNCTIIYYKCNPDSCDCGPHHDKCFDCLVDAEVRNMHSN